MKRFRTIFMGTPEFSVPCLEKLAEKADVIAVVTQPDKPAGRGRRLMPPPVKVFAEEHGIPVYQPLKAKTPEFVAKLRELAPELVVVVAFGQILSQEMLDIPPFGCINVHTSLLPRYRGCAPMQAAILHGERVTGITTMFMNAGLDTGDILLQQEIEIGADETADELHDRMKDAGAVLLMETLEMLSDGTLERQKQDDSLASYVPMLSKEMGRIDWRRPAQEIHNLVRGLRSWPCAYAVWDGTQIKIWRTRLSGRASEEHHPGKILGGTKQGFLVDTGDGILEILEMQMPGKKRMQAADYVRGHSEILQGCFEVTA